MKQCIAARVERRNDRLKKECRRGKHLKYATDYNGRPLEKWEVIKMLIHRIQMGDRDEEAMQWLQGRFGYADSTAKDYVLEAKACVASKLEQYASSIASRNLMRLDTIINESYENGDMSTALKAIDIMNKMGGLYYQNVNVHSDAPIFQIKIGNEE